jgi:hypothetical protein
MTLPPEVEQRLEEGAASARVEFEASWESWKARDVAKWWFKWCARKSSRKAVS